MGAHKDYWIAQHELTAEDYMSELIDAEGFINRMKELGFNEQEAQEQLQELIAESREADNG